MHLKDIRKTSLGAHTQTRRHTQIRTYIYTHLQTHGRTKYEMQLFNGIMTVPLNLLLQSKKNWKARRSYHVISFYWNKLPKPYLRLVKMWLSPRVLWKGQVTVTEKKIYSTLHLSQLQSQANRYNCTFALIYIYIYIYVCVCVCVREYMSVFLSVMNLYIYIYIYIYKCMCICVCMCVCTETS